MTRTSPKVLWGRPILLQHQRDEVPMAGENRIGGFYGDGDRLPETATRPLSILAPPGLASLLIPCCGQLEYTKLCVPSVLQHTRAPFELIFLDIGSLDGTADYLAGVQAAASVRV